MFRYSIFYQAIAVQSEETATWCTKFSKFQLTGQLLVVGVPSQLKKKKNKNNVYSASQLGKLILIAYFSLVVHVRDLVKARPSALGATQSSHPKFTCFALYCSNISLVNSKFNEFCVRRKICFIDAAKSQKPEVNCRHCRLVNGTHSKS